MAIQPSTMGNNAEAGPSTPPSGRIPAYKLAQSLDGHKRSITSLKWSHDGQTLISAGADGLLNFWSATPPSYSLSHVRTLRAHKTGINEISISPDDLYVATASDDKAIHIYPVSPSPSNTTSTPLATSTLSPPLRTLTGHTAPVLTVSFSPKSSLLVSGSFDESAIVWDVRQGVVLRQLPAHSEAVWTVGWDGEGVMVLTGSADGLIRLWDVSTGQCLKTLDNESNSPFTSAFFTPNPFYLVSGTLGVVRIHNIHTGKVVKTFRPNTIAPIPNGNTITVPVVQAENKDSGGGAVVIAITAALPSGSGVEEGGMEVDGVVPRKEAWIMATTGEIDPAAGGKVVIWELGTRRQVQTLEEHKTQVVALAIHPTGRFVATGSLEPEKIINIWRDDE